MRRAWPLVLAAGLAGAPGCKKSDPTPACDKVVDHMLEVTKQQLTGHGDQELGNRKQMIEHCEKRALPPAVRKCLISAKTLAAIAECQPAAKPSAPTGSAPGSGG